MSSKDSKYTSTILPKKLFPKQTNAFVLIDTKEMILDLTILIIDDDCDDREMLQEAIIERMPDAKYLNASNGLEGLHLLLETKEDPQLIFLDLNMSKMNSFEYMANKNEKEGYNKIPIVVYTTSKQMRDKEGSFKLGATYFLIKPTCSKLLKSELQEALKKSFYKFLFGAQRIVLFCHYFPNIGLWLSRFEPGLHPCIMFYKTLCFNTHYYF